MVTAVAGWTLAVSKPLSARNNLAVQQQQRGDVGQNTGQANNHLISKKAPQTSNSARGVAGTQAPH